MTTSALNVRRATVDDLPALRALWGAAQMPADELESRLTEFQVVESGGEFAGALGVQVCGHHARLHSEDYKDFSVADAARERFWERIQKLSSNLGIFRVWTQETSPFWKHWGFQPASAETLARLPEEWKVLEGCWLTLELKNEEAINLALQDKFAGFVEAEKKQTARVANQARQLRLVVTLLLLAVFVLCIIVGAFLLMRRGGLGGSHDY